MKMRAILLLFLISLLSYSIFADEPSEEPSEDGYRSAARNNEPFRMKKMNIIWKTARRMIPENKLKRLYLRLLEHDELELEWKKVQKDLNEENDGTKEAMLRRKLLDLLEEYGIADVIHSSEMKKATTKKEYNSEIFDRSEVFTDKKLRKIWNSAVDEGFSEAELQRLKEELIHHQEKVKEMEILTNQVNQLEDEYGNSIDSQIGSEGAMGRDLGSKRAKLHERRVQVDEEYGQFADRVQYPNFEEPRVHTLWSQIETGNFTSEEKKSLREELTHFENRVKKLRHLEAKKEAMSEGHYDDDKEELEKKVHSLGSKVKKWERELATKIERAARRLTEEL